MGAHKVPSEGEFVSTVNPVQAIREMFVVAVELTRMPGGDTEIAADNQRQLGGVVLAIGIPRLAKLKGAPLTTVVK